MRAMCGGEEQTKTPPQLFSTQPRRRRMRESQPDAPPQQLFTQRVGTLINQDSKRLPAAPLT